MFRVESVKEWHRRLDELDVGVDVDGDFVRVDERGAVRQELHHAAKVLLQAHPAYPPATDGVADSVRRKWDESEDGFSRWMGLLELRAAGLATKEDVVNPRPCHHLGAVLLRWHGVPGRGGAMFWHPALVGHVDVTPTSRNCVDHGAHSALNVSSGARRRGRPLACKSSVHRPAAGMDNLCRQHGADAVHLREQALCRQVNEAHGGTALARNPLEEVVHAARARRVLPAVPLLSKRDCHVLKAGRAQVGSNGSVARQRSVEVDGRVEVHADEGHVRVLDFERQIDHPCQR
mmetsp:Transcript_37799/g.121573  ORF Transcript_37799/g.121573 Transcript_37799/m.121573 type:complete len:290 (+) Transcript_37799:600-1469(+)